MSTLHDHGEQLNGHGWMWMPQPYLSCQECYHVSLRRWLRTEVCGPVLGTSNPKKHSQLLDHVGKCLVRLAIMDHKDCQFKYLNIIESPINNYQNQKFACSYNFHIDPPRWVWYILSLKWCLYLSTQSDLIVTHVLISVLLLTRHLAIYQLNVGIQIRRVTCKVSLPYIKYKVMSHIYTNLWTWFSPTIYYSLQRVMHQHLCRI